MTAARAASFSFAILLALALSARGDELSRFGGLAKIACASGQVVYAAVLSEDMPGPGWENRWRFVLLPDGPAACLTPAQLPEGWRRTSATSRGSYTTDLAGWGVLEILPGDPELRERLRRAAPGSEQRRGFVTITRKGDAIEILIEESR